MTSTESKLLLVANHHLFRECLVNGLRSRVPVLAIDTAKTYVEGIEQSRDTHYDIAVFDADPPAPFSPELTRVFKHEHDATHVVVMGRGGDEEQAVNFIQAGASDFRITDTESLDDFCEAIKALMEGRIDHRPERIRALFARLQKLSADVSRMKTLDAMVLTEREMEILRLLDEGQSNKQIAKELHLSLHTVKNHVHRILEKLQVSNRREAVHLAYNNGWLKLEVN